MGEVTNRLATVPGNSSGNKSDDDDERQPAMGYQQTLMYGRYSRSLGDYAKEESKRLKLIDKQRQKEYRKRKRELSGRFFWRHTFAKIGEDWIFLALLGVIMALVSFLMDYGIDSCNKSRLLLYKQLGDNIFLQYLAWVSLPVFLVLFSAGFVHVIAPQAIGSGIPEMKTILRGVVVCPWGIYANESRQSEMLAAACAVGVACCFGSPIGGVLFSIEVTSVYFAVRNYWRGFFAAVCGAMIFRLLSIWFKDNTTIIAVFLTGFKMDFPYDPQELFVFAMIGVFCGMGGALYVYLHRCYVLWMRRNKKLTKFLQKNRFIYPFLVSLVISSISFPPGLGKYAATDIGTHAQIEILFSNYTWTSSPDQLSVDEYAHVKHWITDHTNVFINLSIYILQTFFLSIIAATLPVPTGVLIPTFKVGAAFGRIVGEAMHVWFPDGVRYGGVTSFIMPGGYATVGAAAFSGAVTHTISISVIVFEMTGQITHCVPVMIAVLISNAIASLLQPSCYDSIILIKKLPYLPDILPSSSGAYSVYVEDFMVRQIKYIWHGMTFSELRQILKDGRKLRSFPLVDNPNHMILLGSIQRTELIVAIENQIGSARRTEVARQRYEERFIREKEKEQRKKIETETRRLRELEEVRKNLEMKNSAKSQRRPSRFGVTPVSEQGLESDYKKTAEEEAVSLGLDPTSPAVQALQNLPRKSILKKSNSYTIHNFPGERRTGYWMKKRVYIVPFLGQDQGTGNPILQSIFRKPGSAVNITTTSPLFSGTNYNSNSLKRVMVFDMSLEEQKTWKRVKWREKFNFGRVHIDPAPFQLVEKTSLLKVHSLFSMLGVNHAYVTAIGRLIGVVGLKELRSFFWAGELPSGTKESEKAEAAGETEQEPLVEAVEQKEEEPEEPRPSVIEKVEKKEEEVEILPEKRCCEKKSLSGREYVRGRRESPLILDADVSDFKEEEGDGDTEASSCSRTQGTHENSRNPKKTLIPLSKEQEKEESSSPLNGAADHESTVDITKKSSMTTPLAKPTIPFRKLTKSVSKEERKPRTWSDCKLPEESAEAVSTESIKDIIPHLKPLLETNTSVLDEELVVEEDTSGIMMEEEEKTKTETLPTQTATSTTENENKRENDESKENHEHTLPLSQTDDVSPSKRPRIDPPPPLIDENETDSFSSEQGNVEDFWINKIKSHCYVRFSKVEEASETRHALDGVKWPNSNPKTLSVTFSTRKKKKMEETAEEKTSFEAPPLKTEPKEAVRPSKEKEKTTTESKESAKPQLLDDLFRKTKTTPCIYWTVNEKSLKKKIGKRMKLSHE
ncbi:CLCN2 [Lepeophtheirus salmonis]|uniref:Chloride channel protein n=1 Tax=Lepeophtheirus salmonis TaxID=72036 RepID=A0A7R8CKN0_LEPSM|nr:CLCN2 [Lepeophtheirus salmonis]CAF2849048.1 CLCN2 [Lepeophtheirus salmonis]